ncbi:MAG: alpha/beta fold hydrolase [Bacteroidota bacterium]
MKYLLPFLLSICCIQLDGNAQKITIKPYLFINKQKDSIQAELGKFAVPENRSKPNGKQLTLSFVRFKSINPNPAAPIVYLAGGPGGSGVNTAKGDRFSLFMRLREVADVIAFDQRGTGMSNELPSCPYEFVMEQDRPIDKSEYLDSTLQHIEKCLDFWKSEGHDLKAYNTTENAFDIEDLRKALGVEKISLWGISYGSHLGFEYIRNFAPNVERVVLASLEGPDETIKSPADTDNFLKEICKRAADNHGSRRKYPELEQTIKSVHEKLKKEPLVYTYRDFRTGKEETVGISNFELQFAIAGFFIRDPQNSRNLPRVYTEMQEGNFSRVAPMVALLKRYLSQEIRPMSFAMDMNSGISAERKARIAKEMEQAILGSTVNFLYYEWMDALDFGQLPNEFRTLPENKVEALLLSGSLDGRTYPKAAKEIAKSFKKGKHIIIDNAGHNLYMTDPLISDLVVNFFKGAKIGVTEIKLEPMKFK